MVQVEVVYSPASGMPIHLELTCKDGATVAEVISQSGLLQRHPETKDMAVGIFAKLVLPDTVVKTGDRIEIYRPLLIDPKENRRQRARKK